MSQRDVVLVSDDERVETAVDPGVSGTYVLVVDLATPTTVEVGALGTVALSAGSYAYVGSAFGPGGFARVERHRRHLAGDDGTVHWHVDALTTSPSASFAGAVLCPGVDVECALARRLPQGPVDGFGSSDCRCRSHLSVGSLDRVGRYATTVLDAGDESLTE